MASEDRPELLVVAGGTTLTGAAGVERVLARLRGTAPGTAIVHHDLRDVAQGVVHRRVRLGAADTRTVVELAHGCVSCTLREDILPLLVQLATRPDVSRLILHLDPILEPEQVCFALRHVLTDGPDGRTVVAHGPEGRIVVTDVADLRGVITVVDTATWLIDATADADIADRGLPVIPDDERTIAQLVVAQAEFADVLALAGTTRDLELGDRTDAVLARLNPLAARVCVDHVGPDLLTRLADGARRGCPESPFAPLLRGQPPLHDEGGIRLVTFTERRPFHPDRLHHALDVLLDGVVRARGRIWLATRPDAALWLESAGGGLQIGYAGDWLAACDDAEWDAADPERRAQAALHWHPRWGDRAQELMILVDGADPGDIDAALDEALLDERELADEAAWSSYPDPFGWWHTDPCDDLAPEPAHHIDHPETRGGDAS